MDGIKDLLQKVNLRDGGSEEYLYSIMPMLYNRISSKELLHSEIIASLLDPSSGHGCNTLFLQKFFKEIELETAFDNSAEYEISIEYQINIEVENEPQWIRRIDILITWNNYAIIVENKLNNAVDQHNQLEDYYFAVQKETDDKTIDWKKYASNKKYEVKKVVYIPCDQIKKAPHFKFDKKLLKEFYPSDLIKWLEDCKVGSVSGESNLAIVNYIELLKYMDIQNKNIMKARKLLSDLNDKNDIKKVLDIASIINSDEWNIAKLDEIVCKLRGIDSNIKFKIKENRYVEIFFEPYKFWVELYCRFDYFELWIADKSSENDVINQQINILGFKHDVMQRGFRYFKNDKKFKYDFPSEDGYAKMLGDIRYLLEHSR